MKLLPLAVKNRYLGVDAVRGFAVLAAIPVIISTFARPSLTRAAAYSLDRDLIPSAKHGLLGLSSLAYQLLFQHSALFLFGIIFGAGVVLTRDRWRTLPGSLENLPRWLGTVLAKTRLRVVFGQTALGLHQRRMAVLLLFGAITMFVLSPHDPLAPFAVAGAVLYFAAPAAWPLLLAATALVFGITGTLSVVLSQSLTAANPDYFQAILQGARPPHPIDTALESAYLTGAFSDQITWRYYLLSDPLFWTQKLQTLGQICGSGLIGMVLIKTRWLTGERLKSRYLMLAALGLGCGTPLVFSGVVTDIRSSAHLSNLDLTNQLAYLGGLGVAIGQIGLIGLAAKSRTCKPLINWLKDIGRIPLTAHLLVSLLCALYFYAAKKLGATPPAELIGLTLALWICVALFARFWMGSCRLGPAEWLWRCLVYAEQLPLFKIRTFEAKTSATTHRTR